MLNNKKFIFTVQWAFTSNYGGISLRKVMNDICWSSMFMSRRFQLQVGL